MPRLIADQAVIQIQRNRIQLGLGFVPAVADIGTMNVGLGGNAVKKGIGADHHALCAVVAVVLVMPGGQLHIPVAQVGVHMQRVGAVIASGLFLVVMQLPM